MQIGMVGLFKGICECVWLSRSVRGVVEQFRKGCG